MIQVRRLLLGLAAAALPLLAGCSSSSTSSPPPPAAAAFVYYTTDESAANPQLGVVNYPVTATSTLATTLVGTAGNGLAFTQNMAVENGNLYVVNDTATATVSVFSLATPLTPTTNPVAILTLPVAISFPFGIAFDSSGNMWVGDFSGAKIYQFTAGLTTTGSPTQGVTLSSPPGPCGLAFDASGNLWEGLDTTTQSVTEFVKGTGFTNATTASLFLDGVKDACGIAIDKNGNLYAGGDPPNSPPKALRMRAMHREAAIHPAGVCPVIPELDGIGFWPAASLTTNCAAPTIVNSTGLASGFFTEQLAFDSAGNLYDADCGTTAHIYVYPTATSPWSTTLAPVTYTDANITFSDCVEGVAIH
jgi:sugar lactone lactonase YvrE